MLRTLRFAARGVVHASRSALATRPLACLSSAVSSPFAPSSVVARSFTGKSFQELGINVKIEQALQEMGIKHPTGIQQKSIQAVLADKDVLCTAQTGTGKTLAYLVPVVEQILRAEAAQTEEDKKKILVSRPLAIVLTPSRELATQVSDVAKKLAHAAKFASATVTSGERKSIQQKNLSRRLDLVIGTPGRIAKCVKAGDFFVSRINTVVVDEADTIFDAKMGFRKELDEILGPIQASAKKRNQPLQIVLVAATVKSPLDQVLMKRFGNLRLVSDNNVHQTPSLIHEEFVRVTPETKHSALRDALNLREFKKEKTIVFCQNSASCRSTDHMLRENGFQSLCLHGGMPPALRLGSMDKFTNDDKVKVLVCTDLAARGLDFADARHVIMFDFPRSAVDYVHRAGRTGRAGVKGFVTSLVTKYDLPLANSINEANRHRRTIKEFRSSKTERGAIPVDKSTLDGESDEDEDAVPRRHAKKQVRGKAAYGTKKLKLHKIRSFRR